ncbi:MAG: NrsF family protein [Piscinibacter sp.]|uniref:NrsF family protein n=1 Tax=Piscinibacter sp. TaxID=1903157 RepID=UPI003D144C33
MKTDELIEMLSRDAGPAPRGVVARRVGPAVVLGLVASVVLAFAVLGFVPAATFAFAAPWFKLAYAAAMVVAAAWLTAQLARPVGRTATPSAAVVGVVLAAALVGLLSWWATPAESRMAGLMGHSWTLCPWFVLGLSLPALAALLGALRGLAPTRPRAAGLAAGLLAGALGAGGYALACTELAMSFVAAWYTLGIAMAGALGALLGPRVLRW